MMMSPSSMVSSSSRSLLGLRTLTTLARAAGTTATAATTNTATTTTTAHLSSPSVLLRPPSWMAQQSLQQRRSVSLLHKTETSKLLKTSPSYSVVQHDLDYAVCRVKDYDPSAYLPGLLLPTDRAKLAYFAVRSLWVETGLRWNSTAHVPPTAAPAEHLEWWHNSLRNVVFASDENETKNDPSSLSSAESSSAAWHPTIRLLRHLVHTHEQPLPWTVEALESLVEARRKDLLVTQYETLDDLETHAAQSCGALFHLVGQALEDDKDATTTTTAAAAADDADVDSRRAAVLHHVAVAHGLTHALRTSIAVLSSTGKLVIPRDLTDHYQVPTPRYVLSALAQGDDPALEKLQHAVQHMVGVARQHMDQARTIHHQLLQNNNTQQHTSLNWAAVCLPVVASEAFLNRLEDRNFQLTDRTLRHVGWWEQTQATARMLLARYRGTF